MKKSTEIKQKIKMFFDELRFVEEHHKYYFEGVEMKTSVSKVTKLFSEQPDWDAIAKSIDKRNLLPEGTTRKEWLRKSREGSKKGDSAHDFAEDYAEDRTLKPKTKYQEAVVKFWEENLTTENIEVVGTELMVCNVDLMIGGMFDLLIYNSATDEVYLFDYKTDKDLFKNYRGKKMFAPFDKLLDQPLSKHSIQLSTYKNMIEQTGINVSLTAVVWLKEDGTYDIYETPDLTKEIEIANKMIPILL